MLDLSNVAIMQTEYYIDSKVLLHKVAKLYCGVSEFRIIGTPAFGNVVGSRSYTDLMFSVYKSYFCIARTFLPKRRGCSHRKSDPPLF